MSLSAQAREENAPSPATPTLECGITGPRGEMGCLLRAPASETLVWDLESEIGSARRQWQEERGAWWVAASYLDTVVDIVLRSFSSVLVMDPHRGDHLLSRDGQTAIQERLL